MPHDDYHAVKQNNRDEWLDTDGVVAVGVSDNGVVITITDPSLTSQFPTAIDGVPIITEVASKFESRPHIDDVDAQEGRDEEHRPVVGGVQVGHGTNTIGTSAFVLENPETGQRFLSSNNHVIADTNDNRPGDPIYQPGPDKDVVGQLADFIPLKDGTTVDLAWAAIDGNVGLSPEIYELDQPTSPVEAAPPDVGDEVTKSGITTGVTTGEVKRIDVDVNVGYGDEEYRIEHCILVEDISDAGDSGSPVVDADGNPAGMIFAGNDQYSVLMAADQIEKQSGLKIRRLAADGGEQPPDDGDDGEEDDGGDGEMPRTSVTLELTPLDNGNGDDGGDGGDDDPEPTRGRLKVTAVDTETDETIAGASVTAKDADGEATTSTDSRGVAFFTVSLESSITVSAAADGYEGDQATVFTDDFE